MNDALPSPSQQRLLEPPMMEFESKCGFAPNYAGGADIFTGATCHRHRLHAVMRALDVSPYGVMTKLLVFDTTEDSSEMQDVAETLLPAPVITGRSSWSQQAWRCWTIRTKRPAARAR